MTHRRLDLVLRIALLVAGAALALVAVTGVAGGRVNVTDSMPVGLYWVIEKPARAVAVGDIVLFCPPAMGPFVEARARGYLPFGDCPGQLSKMFKRVFGLGGDVVQIDAEGVRVNDQLIPHTAPLGHDSAGRALAPFAPRFTLARNEVLLLSNTDPRSFDARYFGPINVVQLREVVVPVLTRR